MAKTKDDLAPDWAALPNWVVWVTIDKNGSMFGFEGEPYPQRIIPAWMLKRSEMRHRFNILPLGTVQVPNGVNWKELIWKRPEPDKSK